MAALVTNEIQLHDYRHTYSMSVTYGETNYTDGYCYLKLNFKANDEKVDVFFDKPILNINADDLTICDKKIWNELNQGPGTGMNSDLLDGLHAEDFKDRLGWYHFNHAFHVVNKPRYVKVATFTPRVVGKPPNFSVNGNKPFESMFEPDKAIIEKRYEEMAKTFVDDTPENLKDSTVRIGNGFESMDMISAGVYNSCFRGTVSYLKNNKKITTVDLHIGIFNDPETPPDNGWTSCQKYFYLSCHDDDLPYIEDLDTYSREDNLDNKGLDESGLLNENDKRRRSFGSTPINSYNPSLEAKDTKGETIESPNDTGFKYIPPVNENLFYDNPQFPFTSQCPNGYQKRLDAFRLYYIKTDIDMIDGKEVHTHHFDLYMRVDERSELHIQPYMSSNCQLYNYQKPITDAQMPATRYLNPLSVYDKRYAHTEHRHYNYEERIEDIENEIYKIFRQFPKYVLIGQNGNNRNRVLLTDNSGNVFCEDQNFFVKRAGHIPNKVIISDKEGFITESEISTFELDQLKDVRDNIQKQIDDINSELENVNETIDGLKKVYVRKTGDHVNGCLTIQPKSNLYDELNPEEGSFNASFDKDKIGLVLKANQTGKNGRIIMEFRDGSNNRYGYVGKFAHSSSRGNTGFEMGASYYDYFEENVEGKSQMKGKSDLVLVATNGVRLGDTHRWARIFAMEDNPVEIGKQVEHGDIWIKNNKDAFGPKTTDTQIRDIVETYRMPGFATLPPDMREKAISMFGGIDNLPEGTIPKQRK